MEQKVTDQTLAAFEAMLKEDEKSVNTIKKYIHDIRYFQSYAKDKRLEKSLTIEYKEHLKQAYAPTSANSMIVALNTYLRYIKRQDCCIKQIKIQKNAFCSEEAELTKEEYLSLVRTAESKKNERLSLIIQTLCSAGIRVSELEHITVEAIKKGETTIDCKGKTRKVFIVSALRKKLLEYAERRKINTGAVFVTKNGNPVNRSNIWREMKALCKGARVATEKVFPHNLRHLFARTFYKTEKDIAKLADILGHSNINTTRIYIISTGAEHRKHIENLRLII